MEIGRGEKNAKIKTTTKNILFKTFKEKIMIFIVAFSNEKRIYFLYYSYILLAFLGAESTV